MTGPGSTATTPGGLPYPASTAPANQGANDIKALALALDGRGHGALVQSGWNVVAFNAGNGAFTFPKAFASPPSVVCAVQYETISGAAALVMMARAPTASGVTAVAYAIGPNGYYTGNLTIMWVAVGVSAS